MFEGPAAQQPLYADIPERCPPRTAHAEIVHSFEAPVAGSRERGATRRGGAAYLLANLNVCSHRGCCSGRHDVWGVVRLHRAKTVERGI